jgi:predicted component of type VI protein secretion system
MLRYPLMARAEELNIVPSILDRLLAEGPEPLANHFQTLSQLKQAVARDLEALLNMRQEALEELPPEFVEVRRSLVVYGLPDFTALNPQTGNGVRSCNIKLLASKILRPYLPTRPVLVWCRTVA